MPAILIAAAWCNLAGCGAGSEGDGSVAVKPGGADSGDGQAGTDGTPTGDAALPDANCGTARGQGCAALIDESAPGCGSSIFVEGEPYVIDVAVAGQRVLWVTEQGLLRARDIAGGAVTTLATFDAGRPILLVDQNAAYYTTNSGVFKLSLTGGTPTLLSAAVQVTAMALSATSLYFAENDPIPDGGNWPATAGIRRVTLSDGSVDDVTVTDAMVTSLAIDDAFVYWTIAQRTSKSVNKYGDVLKAPLGGGTHEVLASNQAFAQGVALDAERVYWCSGGTFGVDTSNGDGAVRSVPKSGGAITELACSLPAPTRLIVTGDYVYWIAVGGASVQGGFVGRVATAGSPSVLLGVTAGSDELRAGLAASTSDVYWALFREGAILRAPLR